MHIDAAITDEKINIRKEEFQVTIANRTPKGLEFMTAKREYLGEQARQYLDFMKKTKAKLEEMKTNIDSLITIGSSIYSKEIYRTCS